MSSLILCLLVYADVVVLFAPAMVFVAVAITMMGIWSAKKLRVYKKEFGKDYPKDRKAMIPFLF